MNGRRLWLRIRKAWIVLGLLVTVVFVTWSLVAYRASGAARAAIRPDASVAVRHDDGLWSFTPARPPSPTTPALVFFPGALVDPVAYAPLLRAVAGAGFSAYLVELPRRGAFGGADDPALDARLARLLARPGFPTRWIAAGHSRGGVVASRVASERRRGFAGLVLIGTSHPRDVDLAALAVPVTKVVGTRDGLASRPEVEANRAKLPPSTRWVWIEGGNHSQFGWYGFQPGDRTATIAASAQREAMVRAVLDALAALAALAAASAESPAS
jgi:pimeloyl-ACP methyl ester carboxylesterase